ncbi:MAG: hypothetical protein J6S87_02345 [Bacteroidales bacterium]|nr:hypothetical protein [Bacteroidales bacterium]
MAKKKVKEEAVVSENQAVAAATEATAANLAPAPDENSIAYKLLSLYHLQCIYSEIDKIRIERGELPNEVRNLEDDIEGKKTRISKFQEEIKEMNEKISTEKNKIQEAQALISRYEEQQNNVRNNREYDSLSKEIEYQTVEIQNSEKKISKVQANMEIKTEEINNLEVELKEKGEILSQKKGELDGLIAEHEEKEAELVQKAETFKEKVEPRLLTAFERIRKNARNGLAIVQISRDACGGCFSTIPPQRQLDIRLHKKIIVCEACGRIFIDEQLVKEDKERAEAAAQAAE